MGTRTLEEALGRAYGHLGRRDRTIAEVRSHLSRGGPDPKVVELAIAELIEQGSLDDERYARCFAEDRRRLDGWGSERIYRRLLELGVERELAAGAAQAEDQASELESALELLHRRGREVPGDDRARRRIMEMLVRRGYAPELAEEAVRRLEREPERDG
jgi:regulatory protein